MAEKKLTKTTAPGVIVGQNSYWEDENPVYHITANANPWSRTDHLNDTNLTTIEYDLTVNDGPSFQIVGLNDLRTFLAQYGLGWA